MGTVSEEDWLSFSKKHSLMIRALFAEAVHLRGYMLTPMNGKRPILKGWNTRPRPTRADVRAWASKGNVGVRTGAASNIVIIDRDLGGDLESVIGPLPKTPTVETGGGGLHLWFEKPDERIGNSTGKLGPHIDVKGEGGVCLLPGSIHPETGKIYRWRRGLDLGSVSPAKLPDQVIARLSNGGQTPSAIDTGPRRRSVIRNACEGIKKALEGTRNDTLYREAIKLGQFIGAGALSRDAVEGALLKAGIEARLSEEASRATIASGIGRGIQSPKPLRGRAVTTIVISTDMGQVVDDAEEALIMEKVEMYRRAGSVVQIVRDSGRLVPSLARPIGAPIIAAVSETHMRERFSDSARWLEKNRQGEFVPAKPPLWAARGLLDRPAGRLRHLEGITETPFLGPDYEIKREQGYDSSSGILLESNLPKPISVPDRPTRSSARGALEKCLGPFQDFPFVSPSDRLVPLAAILSLLARPAISGPCPMFAFRATTPGTGKSLLADLVSLIATGRPAARMSASRDDDEVRKRILAIGLEGSPVVLIDNVEGSLRSQSLAAALTSDTWSDRILGASKTATVPLRAVWLCTGNNLMFEGDLGRRVIPCDLDAACEHPEDRTDFKFPDVKSYVQKKRSALVGAALTILRAYAVAGFPAHGKPPKGSFEAWDQLVRGALKWTAGLDLLDGCERIRSDSDRDLEGLRQLIRSWYEAIGDRPTTAAEIIEKSWNSKNLKFALETMTACDESSLNSIRLGKALQKFNGRVVEGHRIRRVKHNRAGAILWGVEEVKKQDGV